MIFLRLRLRCWRVGVGSGGVGSSDGGVGVGGWEGEVRSDTIPAAASISGDITRRRWLPSITCCQPHNSNKVHLCSNITHCNQQLHRAEIAKSTAHSTEQRAESTMHCTEQRVQRAQHRAESTEKLTCQLFFSARARCASRRLLGEKISWALSLFSFVFICLFVETKTRFKTTPPTLIKYCHYCNMLAITFFPSLWKSI